MIRLYCTACRHRFGRRSVCFVTAGGGAVLCRECAASPVVHARLFFNCSEAHGANAHCTPTTRAVAHWLKQATPR